MPSVEMLKIIIMTDPSVKNLKTAYLTNSIRSNRLFVSLLTELFGQKKEKTTGDRKTGKAFGRQCNYLRF